MSGSDKKQQKAEAEVAGGGGTWPLAVDPPDVSGFTLPGDPPGLIPREKLQADQITTIASWPNPPGNGETESWTLRIARHDSAEWQDLQKLTYTGGDPWIPLQFTISKDFLLDPENEGRHDLVYFHLNFAGQDDTSPETRIQIDKVPPNDGMAPGKLTFSFAQPVVDAHFTPDAYLEFEVPSWTGPDVDDVTIAFGLSSGELPSDPGDIELIGPDPVKPGDKVRIPKAMVEKAGDGYCAAGYVLIDKAGNISPISQYELFSVALGVLPVAPLASPTVVDPTGGELVRADVIDGVVNVTFPRVTNAKETDKVIMKWGATELGYTQDVGSNPATHTFAVAWKDILAEYGTATGKVTIPVQYFIVRGVERFESTPGTVDVNFSTPGPGPNPDPDPGNDLLEPVVVLGKSNVPNELVSTDEDEDIFAHIELVDPLEDGDTYQVKWNGVNIGIPYVIDTTNDTAGDTIEIALDWDIIRTQGPSATMPVWYELTNAAHGNPQEPDPRTSVKIDFLSFKLPEAIAGRGRPGMAMIQLMRLWSGT